jgi:hypothetical protein
MMTGMAPCTMESSVRGLCPLPSGARPNTESHRWREYMGPILPCLMMNPGWWAYSLNSFCRTPRLYLVSSPDSPPSADAKTNSPPQRAEGTGPRLRSRLSTSARAPR